MKNILMTSMLLGLLATAAVAQTAPAVEDFDANEFIATAKSGNLEFSLGTVDGELSTVKTGAYVAAWTLGADIDTNVYTALTYDRLDETLAASAELNVQKALNQLFAVYGSAELSYVAPTADLDAGDTFVTPTVGAKYTFADGADVFAEVAYDWNVSNDWAQAGGAAEVGVDYFVTDRIAITPSLVRTFDTDTDATNLKVELGLVF